MSSDWAAKRWLEIEAGYGYTPGHSHEHNTTYNAIKRKKKGFGSKRPSKRTPRYKKGKRRGKTRGNRKSSSSFTRRSSSAVKRRKRYTIGKVNMHPRRTGTRMGPRPKRIYRFKAATAYKGAFKKRPKRLTVRQSRDRPAGGENWRPKRRHRTARKRKHRVHPIRRDRRSRRPFSRVGGTTNMPSAFHP